MYLLYTRKKIQAENADIKPVLQIQGAKLDQFAKPRNFNKAKEIMIDAVKADLADRFAGLNAEGKMKLSIAYTDTDGEAQIFKKEVEEAFGMPVESVDPVSYTHLTLPTNSRV